MTTGRTRRAVDPLGAQGGSHASPPAFRRASAPAPAVAASPCPDPCPAARGGRPAGGRARLRRRGLSRLRRPHAGAARLAVGREQRAVPAGAGRRRRAGQLADAAHAQRRRAGGSHRTRAQRSPGAADRARARVAAGVHRAALRRSPSGGLADARSGLDELDVERRCGPAPRVRRRDRRRARARLEGAPRTRALRGDRPRRSPTASTASRRRASGAGRRSASTRSTGTR